MERREKLEQKESYYKNQAEKNRRIVEHSLDGENKKIYSHRAWQCEKKAAEVEKELEKTDERLSLQLPKGYADTRNVGVPISQEELQKFAKTAKNLNIEFAPQKGSKYGGFELYCGDTDVLYDILNHLKHNQKILTEIANNDRITLRYAYLTDGGAVDYGTFACTRGHTITFNKFFYDDTEFLKSEYAESVNSGVFAKGTSYHNVPDHECGHIFARYNKRYISALRQVCEKHAGEECVSFERYVKEKISSYAVFADELPAEINSMRFGKESDLAVKLLEEADLK